jgi:murein DD-endopeptidase MepM/ murein hydrolase activator NlpD
MAMQTSHGAGLGPSSKLGCLAMLLAAPLLGVCGIAFLAGGGASQTGMAEQIAVAGIPPRVASAYRNAGGRCPGLDWTLLAAVGAVETRHGQVGAAQAEPTSGEVRPWIFGPALDGGRGTAAIPIGRWVGWWGLTGPSTRAVGPMQFLPTTFEAHAVDADDDGTTNPHDIDDAAATAAAFICRSAGGDVDGPTEVALIYNPGDPTYAEKLATERERIRTLASTAAAPGAAVCPVLGPVEMSDTFGAARSGGRSHEGVDIFAPYGTPVVAPASGTIEHRENSIGGRSYHLVADDGTYYYGTHLSDYENVGAGHVEAGTIIGYVGTSGNAAGTPPHLHWEIHPAGRGTPPINPTDTAQSTCQAG